MRFWGFLSLLFLLFFVSCGTNKSVRKSKTQGSTADKIVANALQYKGVKYKYGGTTKKGMDCSGIVYTSFLQEKILLPRVSRNMAKKGFKIPLKRARKGDLLFFETSKKRKGINHVGLVISVKKGVLKFIHSTTSRGVIVSSLSDKYWKKAFVKAKRVL
ncbi:C40 family peptidase [Polaribacter sp.]|uniref:C40 family peptidase n=1 Tax=Polaribacter sp. TaxID=1920175 RepID=UPI003F6A54CF